MSGGSDVLAPRADDIVKMLVAQVHSGSRNLDVQMAPYVYKRRPDGINTQLICFCCCFLSPAITK